MDKRFSFYRLKAGLFERSPLLSQKNNVSLLYKITKKMKGNEAGVTLIETLIALAILGLIAVAFLGGLATGAKATLIADERATAESLARSQMEYVKSQTYADLYTPAEIPDEYDSYTATIGVDDLPDPEDGIQKITVTVSHGDKQVLTVEGYKVDRYEAE